MSISIKKSYQGEGRLLAGNRVIRLGVQQVDVNFTHTVTSVSVNTEGVATLTLSTTAPELFSEETSTYNFAYNPEGGDIMLQAEAFLLTLSEFTEQAS